MAGNNELKYYELNNRCDFEGFNFDSTDELEPINGIIGQERARKAMDIGLKIKADGYNIYMCGPSGLGKTTYAKMCAMEAAKNEPKAWDYCYVYNFDEPKRPLSLKFEAGRGKEFRDDMNELVEFFDSELVKVFSSADYEEQKSDILKKFDEKRNALVKEISDIAAKHGFAVKSSNGGMFFMPIISLLMASFIRASIRAAPTPIFLYSSKTATFVIWPSVTTCHIPAYPTIFPSHFATKYIASLFSVISRIKSSLVQAMAKQFSSTLSTSSISLTVIGTVSIIKSTPKIIFSLFPFPQALFPPEIFLNKPEQNLQSQRPFLLL